MNRDTFLTLLTKKIAGELSEADEQQLQAALEANEEYRGIYTGILLSTPVSELKLDPEKKLATVWSNIGTAPEADQNSKVVPFRYLRFIAASVLIIVVCYWLISKNNVGAGSEEMITIYAQDQKLDTILKDGTHVLLNENSQLSFSKNFGEQSMSLILQGHAFFDVVKKTTIPMIIQAGPVNIVVKGTAFYVNNSRSRNVEVKLLRGLVEVSNRRDSNDKVLLKPNQTLSIAEIADHNLQYSLAGIAEPDTIKPVYNSDTLAFNNKKLDLLAPLLERKYNTKIEIRNEALKSKRFSGRFVAETLQEALQALQITYPFSFKMVDKTIIIE